MATVDTSADLDPDVEENDDEEPALRKKKFSGKKLTFFVFLPLMLLGGAAGAYFSGVADPIVALVWDPSHAEQEGENSAIFYELPEMLVNLNGNGKQSAFLKLRVALELDDLESIPLIERVLPRVIDNFQVYLRELRIDDLKGSAGMFRLKEELLVRVNAAVSPIHVKDVLFKEMIVQ